MSRRMSFVDDDDTITGMTVPVLPFAHDAEGELRMRDEISAHGFCEVDEFFEAQAIGLARRYGTLE
jgi:hypothetical protein